MPLNVLSVRQKEGVDFIGRLRDDDMAYLLGMHTKELHKLCGRLREDRFLAVYVSNLFHCARV
jgi:transcription initiation factor IIE alpha subunit